MNAPNVVVALNGIGIMPNEYRMTKYGSGIRIQFTWSLTEQEIKKVEQAIPGIDITQGQLTEALTSI
jgi:hypothetical protein